MQFGHRVISVKTLVIAAVLAVLVLAIAVRRDDRSWAQDKQSKRQPSGQRSSVTRERSEQYRQAQYEESDGSEEPPASRSSLYTSEPVDDYEQVAQQPNSGTSRPARRAARQENTEESVARGYRVPAEDLEFVVQDLRKRFALDGVAIGSDTRTSQVVVHAPLAVHQQIAGLLRPRNSEAAAPAPQRTASGRGSSGSYQLRHLTSDDFVATVRAIWGDQVVFARGEQDGIVTARIPSQDGAPVLLQIDHRTQRVAAVGTNPSRGSVDKIVQAIDHPGDNPEVDSQIVSVNKSDRQQVRKAISAILTSAQATREDDSVAVQGRNQVSRNGKQARRTQQIAQALPQNQQGRNEQGKEDREAQALIPAEEQNRTPIMGLEDEDAGLIGPVQIEFIEGLDVYIVRGKKRDVERVVQIIADIEAVSKETQPEVEIRPLDDVASVPMADLLNQIYDQVLSTRQGRVTILALVKPNALLLIGRKESVQVVKELIAKLDQPTSPSALWKVFRLKHASVTEAAVTVQNLFSGVTAAAGQPGAGGGAPGGFGGGGLGGAAGPTGLRPRITVISDVRSNSLIVQASGRDLEEVSALIEEIDVEASVITSELRVFKLTNTLAQELAPVLQDAIRGTTTARAGAGGQQGQFGQQGGFQQGGQFPGQGQQGVGGAGQQNQQVRSTSLQFVTIDQQGKKTVASGIATDVVITADVAVNALVVRAPAKAMDLISAIIDELDSGPDAQAQIKVFTIVNGDATYLGQTLQQLFGQQVTIGRGQGGAFGGAAQFGALGGAFGNAAGQTGTGETNLVPLRFAIDARSNSIIASGSSGDLAVVEVLLLRLDESNVRSRKLSVFRLKNAFAQDVANAITTFLQSQRTLFQQDQIFNTSVSPWDQLERQVIVTAEPQTNSVIVSATPNFVEPITEIINQLDFRPAMVMVQVLIAEVNLADVYEFGVELGLQDSLVFDRGKASLASGSPAATPGFNFNNVNLPNQNSLYQGTLAGQAISGFGLGRAGTLGYGGLVASAANESINLLVRALEDSNRLQVLSRPEIMAVHNRPAQILVGQKVPRITNSTINNLGNTQNTLQDVDVGIILNIIPQINDDGVVVLYVEAQKSAVGPEEQGVVVTVNAQGQPVKSPRIDTTSAFTTISAKDGQTVVFAGLITSTKQEVVRRVPYLSDIPVLGQLFRFETDTQKRTELLIVMTPKIVQYDADYQWLNDTESRRMNWCLGDVVSVHGDVGLKGGSCLFCNDRLPTIYPDEDPTAYEVQTMENAKPMPDAGTMQPATGTNDGVSSRTSPGMIRESNWNPQAGAGSPATARGPRPAERRPAVNQAGGTQGPASPANNGYPAMPAEYAAQPGDNGYPAYQPGAPTNEAGPRYR